MQDRISFIFLLLTFFAEVIGTIGGFGSSVFFVPIANFYFDFESVLGLTALFHIASNLSKIAQFRKGLNRQLILNLGIPAVIFVIVGGLLTKYFDNRILEMCLGFFLVLFSGLFLVFDQLVIKQGRFEAIVGGTLSGLFAGLLGTGGAVRGLTMAAFNMEKQMFIATSAVIDFGVDFTRSIVYFFLGYIHVHDLIYVPFLVLISWFGTKLGKYILSKIPQSRFRKISLFFILIIGTVTLVKVFY